MLQTFEDSTDWVCFLCFAMIQTCTHPYSCDQSSQRRRKLIDQQKFGTDFTEQFVSPESLKKK